MSTYAEPGQVVSTGFLQYYVYFLQSEHPPSLLLYFYIDRSSFFHRRRVNCKKSSSIISLRKSPRQLAISSSIWLQVAEVIFAYFFISSFTVTFTCRHQSIHLRSINLLRINLVNLYYEELHSHRYSTNKTCITKTFLCVIIFKNLERWGMCYV